MANTRVRKLDILRNVFVKMMTNHLVTKSKMNTFALKKESSHNALTPLGSCNIRLTSFYSLNWKDQVVLYICGKEPTSISRCSSTVFMVYGLVGSVDDGKTLSNPQTFKMSGAWPPPAPSLQEESHFKGPQKKIYVRPETAKKTFPTMTLIIKLDGRV